MKFWICGVCGKVIFDATKHRQFTLIEFDTGLLEAIGEK